MSNRNTHGLKYLSAFLAFALVIMCLPGLSANASAPNTQNTSDLIAEYMDARYTGLMTGDFSALETVSVSGIVKDEDNHRSALINENLELVNSTYSVTNVEESDTMTFVNILENLTTGHSVQESTIEIEHTVTIMFDENGIAKVVSDRYIDLSSNFKSCSYVDPNETVASPNALASSACIIYMAQTQIGYKEKASNSSLDSFTDNAGTENYTKYGQWYGTNPGPWCAMFVSWCANQVGISTSVIPKYSVCTTGMNTFIANNVFNYSTTYGGSYTPKAGDIFFTGTSKTSSSHTGIVESVSGSTITVIDGNCSDQVAHHTMSLSDSSLIGFAHPKYVDSSHLWVSKGTYYQCSRCGKTTTSTSVTAA